MILEISRALTDWFNDETHGIAAQLALLPFEDGDSMPDVGTIADQTRNNLVAQLKYPSVPGIAVNVRQITELDGENNTVTGDGMADVLVRIARDDVDAKIAASNTSNILRAVLRSWRLFNAADRTRNDVQIGPCDKLAIAPDWSSNDDIITTGAATGRIAFRDLLARP